jgi:four helix bundle protein
MKDESEPIGDKPVRDLRSRTLEFGVRIIRLADALPKTSAGWVIAKQILRSGTAVGAIYREGCRSRSDAESISKFENVLQELDETAYWLELIVGAELLPATRLAPIQDETDQLISIFVTCVKKVKRHG